jgi:hypothetical protein
VTLRPRNKVAVRRIVAPPGAGAEDPSAEKSLDRSKSSSVPTVMARLSSLSFDSFLIEFVLD